MTGSGFDHEQQAAEHLDQAIETVLGRGPTVPADRETLTLLRHLAVVCQPPVPPGLAAKVESRLGRPASAQAHRTVLSGAEPYTRLLRLLAGALGVLFLAQALTLMFAGEALARFLGFQYDPHMYFEQGLAYLAVAIGLFTGVRRPDRLQGGLTVALPLSIMLGFFGLLELPHSPNPGAESFHFVQAALAGALAYFWFRRARNGRASP